MKAGIKTTEFWVTLVTQVLGILVLCGVFNPEVSSQVSGQLGPTVNQVTDVIQNVVALVAMAASGFGYAKSRGIAKKNR